MLCVAGIAVGCCTTPEKVVSPIPSFAYVANENSNDISGYTVDNSTGALTEVVSSPFAGPAGPRDSVVELFGKFLYVANGGTNGVSGYSIDGTSGVLTPVSGSPFAGGGSPRGIALHPTGKFVYTADRSSNSVSGFAINTTTGVLTAVPGSPFTIPAEGEEQPGPQQLTIDPSGRFLYVSDHLTGDISAFTINGTSGALTAISGSPFTDQPDDLGPNIQPFALAVTPDGKFLYVTNHGQDTLSVFSINAATGALTPAAGSPFDITVGEDDEECGSEPYGLAIAGSGRFLYVADNGCDTVSAFTIDSSTGAPTEISGSPYSVIAGDCFAGVNDATVDYTGRFLYVADNGCGAVTGFSIDNSTGALTELTSSPFPAGSGPYGVAISRIN